MQQWSDRAKRNVRAIVLQSIQDVSERAQLPVAQGGRMPVGKTGFLRNSYQAGIKGSTSLTGPTAYIAALAGFEVGQTFQAGWKAPYARRIERGFVGPDSLGRVYNQPGRFFMESALMDWQAINDANAARLR